MLELHIWRLVSELQFLCQNSSFGETIETHLGDGLFAATTADAHSVDYDALLGPVTQPPGLVWPRGACQSHDTGQLTVLPAPDAQQKAQDITLLLLPELLHILQNKTGSDSPGGCRELAVALWPAGRRFPTL